MVHCLQAASRQDGAPAKVLAYGAPSHCIDAIDMARDACRVPRELLLCHGAYQPVGLSMLRVGNRKDQRNNAGTITSVPSAGTVSTRIRPEGFVHDCFVVDSMSSRSARSRKTRSQGTCRALEQPDIEVAAERLDEGSQGRSGNAAHQTTAPPEPVCIGAHAA